MPGIEPAGLAARNYRFPKSTPRRQWSFTPSNSRTPELWLTNGS